MSEAKKPTNLQIFLFFIGFVTLFTLIFVLGVVVGKGLSSRGQVEVAQQTTEETIPEGLKIASDSESDYNEEPDDSVNDSVEQEQQENEDKNIEDQKIQKEVEIAKEDSVVKEVAKVNKVEVKKEAAQNNLGYEKKPETPEPVGDVFPATDPGGNFTLQVGSFKDESGAKKILNSYKAKGYPAFMTSMVTDQNEKFYRVRIGTFSKRDTAKKYFEVLQKKEKDINGFITTNK